MTDTHDPDALPQGQWLALSMTAYNAIEAVRGSEMAAYQTLGLLGVQHRRATPMEETKAMRMGSAIHSLMEGRFELDWVAAPPEMKTRTSKAWNEFAKACAPDLRPILHAEALVAAEATEALQAHPWVASFMEQGPVLEPSMVYQGCKLRPDAFGHLPGDPSYLCSVNWKTCTMNAFERWANSARYNTLPSAGLYANVYREVFEEPVVQVYPVVAQEEPYPVQVFILGKDTERLACMDAAHATECIRDAVRTGNWADGYLAEPEEL